MFFCFLFETCLSVTQACLHHGILLLRLHEFWNHWRGSLTTAVGNLLLPLDICVCVHATAGVEVRQLGEVNFLLYPVCLEITLRSKPFTH